MMTRRKSGKSTEAALDSKALEIQRKFRGSPVTKEYDPTPVEMPVGYTHPPSLQDLVARMVRQAIEEEQGEEFESIEEADDLEVTDENLLTMPSDYEIDELTEEEPIAGLLEEPDPDEPPPAPAEQDREDPGDDPSPGETDQP